MSGAHTPRADVVDIDLQGVVGVRVVGASREESAAIATRLGGVVRPLEREADVVVHFVPRLHAAGLRFVELGRSGFTDDGFYLLSHRRRPVRVRLPFGGSGKTCDIVCERGRGPVPFLDAWIKLAAIRRGYIPVHASAFSLGGAGVLVTGWAHGGKTSCLLAFAGTGARFVSDDLVFLSADGHSMLGVSTPISVSPWQLDQLPARKRYASRWRRLLSAGARELERLTDRMDAGVVGAALRVMIPAIQRRLRVEVSPASLFGPPSRCVAEPTRLFLALTHAANDIRVEPAEFAAMVDRIVIGLQAELLPCFEQYLAYRFAFPDADPDPIESALEEVRALLTRALSGMELFVLRHPHPVLLDDLRRALLPHVNGTSATLAGAVREAL